MSKPIHAGCLCGQVRITIAGPPAFAITCYCRDCQHVSGGGHAPQLAFDAGLITVKGPVSVFAATSDSGNDLAFTFCPNCGSPLLKSTSMAASRTFVYAGALDDPSLFSDAKPVFEKSRQPWDGA